MENVNVALSSTASTTSSVIVQTKLEEGCSSSNSVALVAGSISDSQAQQQLHHHHQQQQQQQQHHQQRLSSLQNIPSATSSPVLSPPPKGSATFGRNNNGTMVTTSTPSNEAELQLYRVLQRASLLAYYDTLLEMGGDDVQQLCDAGEEEFLEIMALVGMAKKPLHVRRLQKSLHEWAMNPASFQTPISSMDITSQSAFSPEPAAQSRSPFNTSQAYSPSSISGNVVNITSPPTGGSSSGHTHFSSIGNLTSMSTNMPTALPTSSSHSAVPLNPTLTDTQMVRLAAAAEEFSRSLPPLEPKPQNSKKKSSKDLEQVLAMSECDPRRMDEIRKYAAIYGRFDCKRRPEKPLTVHELCVNEAASQICKLIPALLFRRDELFHHARKVVRKSGFGPSAGIPQYEMGQSLGRSSSGSREHESGQAKRLRLSCDASADFNKETADEMRHNLLAIYQKLGRTFEINEAAKFSSSYSRSEYDETDSRYSFSNSSSPQQQSLNGNDQDLNNSENTEEDCKHIPLELCKSPLLVASPGSASLAPPHGCHVISASGSHIIAVANPALALSSALVTETSMTTIKCERLSPGPADI